ncbi:MAG: carboxylating nicotinate-nucleotide diphosphorylase [Thermodesulfobacteriota bacterium]
MKTKKRTTPRLDRYTEVLIRAALVEDLGPGDITTDAVVPRGTQGSASIVAKQPLIVCGLSVAGRVFASVDRRLCFTPLAKDGARVRKGAVIAKVEGGLRGILSGERVALNFLQKLSGVATLTSEFVKKAGKRGPRILDTRKTTPCMRILEKYAVKTGGGENHRLGLFDAVLIKDNHITAAGGVGKALDAVKKRYRGKVSVEVETKSLQEVREALHAGADLIMLDNMGVAKIKKAMALIGERALVEVSGGITLENVGEVSRSGVDFISVGGLTHSAPAVDISLKVTRCTPGKSK